MQTTRGNTAKAKRARQRKARVQVKRDLLGGISRRRLAQLTGLDHSHLARVLRGERSLSVAAMRKVAAALGVTLDELDAALAKTQKKGPTSVR